MSGDKKPYTRRRRTTAAEHSKAAYVSPKIHEFGPVGILTGGGVSGAPEMGMSMSQMMTDLP